MHITYYQNENLDGNGVYIDGLVFTDQELVLEYFKEIFILSH